MFKAMFFYEVLVVNKYCNKSYIYSSDKLILNRKVVFIEFGKSKTFGIILNKSNQIEKAKMIINVWDYQVSESFLKFIIYFAEFNFLSVGSVLELVFPANSFFKGELNLSYNYNGEIKELSELFELKLTKKEIKQLNSYTKKYDENLIKLEQDQIDAINFIKKTKKTCVLEGVTGSGKTIVALESVAHISNKILILVPEINLAKNWVNAIKYRFGKVAHVYHSKVKDSYKKHFYKWVISKEGGFIIGTRSSLMLPYVNLDVIIVDEEHSVAYKQENYPYYNARDMAVLRGFYEKNSVLLLSATLSMETVYNIKTNKYDCFTLKREPKYGLATVDYIQGSSSEILAPEIIKESLKCFEQNQQVLFFLNRKGYVPYCICNECKSILSCFACNSAKTLYKDYQVICNKCMKKHYLPKICPCCNKITTWKFFGIGIQKLYDYITNLIPNYKFLMVSCDSEDIDSDLNYIFDNKVNGIIATQILAQGYDFKNIGLVVVVDADMGIGSTDFRVLERMYQLWQQIRGRSGRHDIKGRMLIQFFKKDNRFIEIFKKGDVKNFLLNDRKIQNWPPFSKCAFLKFKGRNKQKLDEQLSKINFNFPLNIFGPLYYGMKKNIHEFRFLVKAETYNNLFKILKEVKFNYKNVEIEVDPYLF